MHVHEVLRITTYIHDLYRDRFPPLAESMARIWYEELKHLNEDLVTQAINRWARHHTILPPSLDQLLEQVEYLRDEQRLTKRQGSSEKTFLDVLRDAAEAQANNPERSEHEAHFGHLMALIGERSVGTWLDEQGVAHEKLTLEQRATQCYEWANRHQAKQPDLAENLRYTARVYARIYHEQQEAP